MDLLPFEESIVGSVVYVSIGGFYRVIKASAIDVGGWVACLPCVPSSLLHTSYYVKYNEHLISECTVSVTKPLMHHNHVH